MIQERENEEYYLAATTPRNMRVMAVDKAMNNMKRSLVPKRTHSSFKETIKGE